jgi:uncharacterized protein YndB with AHSA1/START domain
MEPGIVQKVVVINASSDKIWKALTDPQEMNKWYFDIPEFIPEEGKEFSFIGGTEEKKYVHLCRILKVVFHRELSYNWRYEGYPGNSVVTFEIFPEGKTCRVSILHKGLDTFPSDNPDFAEKNFKEGWEHILEELRMRYNE